MPLPEPRPDERQYQFISRCYEQIKDEYNRAQSFAICYSRWKDRNS